MKTARMRHAAGGGLERQEGVVVTRIQPVKDGAKYTFLYPGTIIGVATRAPTKLTIELTLDKIPLAVLDSAYLQDRYPRVYDLLKETVEANQELLVTGGDVTIHFDEFRSTSGWEKYETPAGPDLSFVIPLPIHGMMPGSGTPPGKIN